jgi:hypothetical protein
VIKLLPKKQKQGLQNIQQNQKPTACLFEMEGNNLSIIVNTTEEITEKTI